ncbi:4-hydroxy-tetrahydrodipicolinate synthase [uncultured archaeon]|nr:4-hydroxy-tetrahydrodipicolinate synthase [uncultured archaeon]
MIFMDEKKFRGVFTAIITPFKRDESVDYDSLGKLVEFQIKNGVAGIVPCGTTGESPTLNHEEHKKVIDFVIKKVKKRCLVVAGTGSNCTKEAVELSRDAEHAGADALLLVNPYYNKPTQEGLFLHFKKIADSVKIPVIIYNIKGRTGVNVETSTLIRIISACPNVLAVKEASGDLNQMMDVIAKAPRYFSVLSGDDNMTLNLIKAGGMGVISVASNAVPKEMVQLVDFALSKNYPEAERVNSKLASFFENIFIETNPIPIKFVLAQKKMCEEVYRLPMCEMTKEHKEKVSALIKQMGLI